jgi:hypothetical protein
MAKILFSRELLEFLNLDSNQKYSKKFIEKIIRKNKICNKRVKTFFPDYEFCSCGQCDINKNDFYYWILRAMVVNPKPTYNFYEFEQKPKNISNLE